MLKISRVIHHLSLKIENLNPNSALSSTTTKHRGSLIARNKMTFMMTLFDVYLILMRSTKKDEEYLLKNNITRTAL